MTSQGTKNMYVYDESSFNQSAVIPYRITKGKVKILLVTNYKGSRWIIPKGIIEPDLTAATSAAKEAEEEAGVTGTISKNSIGRYSYKKWGGVCKVQVFLLRVEKILDEWEEDYREREWVSVKEATQRVREEKLKSLIWDVPDLIL
ncbi:NUDIX hydrolase [Anaerolineales bacterium HSG24]|nr:NUDIX hydrolase [Anaerolineales bacterium HSG24]